MSITIKLQVHLILPITIAIAFIIVKIDTKFVTEFFALLPTGTGTFIARN